MVSLYSVLSEDLFKMFPLSLARHQLAFKMDFVEFAAWPCSIGNFISQINYFKSPIGE